MQFVLPFSTRLIFLLNRGGSSLQDEDSYNSSACTLIGPVTVPNKDAEELYLGALVGDGTALCNYLVGADPKQHALSKNKMFFFLLLLLLSSSNKSYTGFKSDRWMTSQALQA